MTPVDICSKKQHINLKELQEYKEVPAATKSVPKTGYSYKNSWLTQHSQSLKKKDQKWYKNIFFLKSFLMLTKISVLIS